MKYIKLNFIMKKKWVHFQIVPIKSKYFFSIYTFPQYAKCVTVVRNAVSQLKNRVCYSVVLNQHSFFFNKIAECTVF